MIDSSSMKGAALLLALLLCGPVSAQMRPVRPMEGQNKKVIAPRRDAREIPPPDDVARPPAEAERYPSGLASILLQPSAGGERPTRNDMVTVRYTGWTADGEMFDSTEPRGTPRSFRVNGVIEGFAEAMERTAVGEKRRFWLPSELAYGDRPDKPQGPLCFDVELISIRRGPPTPADVAAAPDDAQRTASGLAYRVLREGRGGQRPAGEDTVLVEHSSWSQDGELIDSTMLTGEPASYTLHMTIPAFSEAFQLMTPGEKRRLWATPELVTLNGRALHDGPVVFDVELISFLSKPETPPDVAGIPADAELTDSGLAYKVLREGGGERHPVPGSVVRVQYAGWTRDGRMFDSSYNHGQPGTFTLNATMPLGWNEALYMMVEGEKRRIWIPEQLAYGGRSDRPAGMLIFDVELLSIED